VFLYIYIYIHCLEDIVDPTGTLCDESSAVFGMKAVKFRILCSQVDVFEIIILE
jgi:hypothetical protein